MDYRKMYKEKVKPELTEEQKKSPYAAFYEDPVLEPAADVIDNLICDAMPQKNVVGFDQLKKVFLPNAMPQNNGWCIAPDGTGYSSVLTICPEVTPERLAWWYGWFNRPDYDYLNYKIWMPGWHKSHGVPLIEDVGWGYLEAHSDGFFNHSILDLDEAPEDMDPKLMKTVVSTGVFYPEGHPEEEEMWNSMVKLYKRNGEGIQIQTLNYIGVKIVDGKFVKMSDADPEKVRMFSLHNAYESHRMGTLIPKLYKFAKENNLN